MERDFLGKRLSCSFPKEQIRSRASCTHCCRLQPKLLSDPQACPCIVLSFGCLRLSDRGDTNPREQIRSRASCTHCCRLQPKLLSDPQACPCIVLSFGCLRLSDRGDTNPRERLSQECLRSATSAQEFHVSGL